MFYHQGNQIRKKPTRRVALEHGDEGSVSLILTDLRTHCLPEAPAGVVAVSGLLLAI